MFYRVDRVYITNENGHYARERDDRPYLVEGNGPNAAALRFVNDDGGVILGTVTELPGGRACATAQANGRVYAIFIDRAIEAIAL